MIRKLTLAACLITAGGISCISAGAARGEDAVLEELYGRGVHRYFAGDYVQAHAQLSMAIDGGTTDPRAYYFRGLTLMATGRVDEGYNDWRLGAQYEARGTFNAAIGRALVRIQGPARVVLERVRQSARVAALQDSRIRNQALYGPGAPAVAPTVKGVPAEGQSAAVRSNPFREDQIATVEGTPSVESPDAFSKTLEESKAGAIVADETSKATKSTGAGGPAGAAGSGNAGDPFGGDAPAADPFGGSPSPASNDPFGGGGGVAPSDDPFGNF